MFTTCISVEDKSILRELAKKLAEIASLPAQKEKAQLWKRLNSLQAVKPLVWINEIPWHEMDVSGELQFKTKGEFSRSCEWDLRRKIYQWEHMRADMVVEPVVYSPLVVKDSGFGITEDVDIIRTDNKNDIVSRHFNIQISQEADVSKIKDPVVTLDIEATNSNYEALKDICEGIISVEKRGMAGFWFAPWDELIRWMGVQEALTNLYEYPELIHKSMDRLVNAYLCRLDQYEKLNLLSLNNKNERVGSGGYGYTDELPKADFDPSHVRTKDLWGCGTAQIFCDVSPAMHDEFALQYELKWMKRFGLNYYGCCEPLHRKMGVLQKVPNLRKVSMSRWINPDEAVNVIGNKYVFSYKPNPAIFATDIWDPSEARRELEEILKKAKAAGCIVEIIMKDISTIKYQPQRLWEWAKLATDTAEAYG